jgi:phenylpyruvate tautomerase PptA (4-oxalocrotonate tautomerase family)
MPYIEILSSRDPADEQKQSLVERLTGTIVEQFHVAPTAVTVFFLPIDPAHYAYRGRLADDGSPRVFIKFHAYRRDAERRRAVAAPISEAVAACFSTEIENVSIYFFEREFDEVVHDGLLVSDGKRPAL